MKKQIKGVLLVLVAFLLFVPKVGAIEAKIPTTVPTQGEELHSMLDAKFNFGLCDAEGKNCKIYFPTDKNGKIDTINNIQKIILSKNTTLDSNGFFVDYFSAYCLDGQLKYPEYSAHTETDVIEQIRKSVINSILSDETYINLLKTKGFPDEPAAVSLQIQVNFEAPTEASKTAYAAGEDLVVTLKDLPGTDESGNPVSGTEAAIKLFYLKDEEFGLQSKILVSDLPTATITINKTSSLYDKYTAINMPENSINYNKALWVIEHSYPTITIDELLRDAGSSKDAVVSDLVKLGLTNEQALDQLPDFIYTVTQYSIWKVQDNYVRYIDGVAHKLGDTLVGSTELDKVYKYLIANRGDIYTNYDTHVYGQDLTVSVPETGKELYKTSDTAYRYGPYKVTSNMITAGSLSVGITATDSTDIILTDASGSKVSNLTVDTDFYVQVPKTNKSTEVKVKVSTTDGKTFETSGNRGRIYSPSMYIMEQQVASGGKVISISKDIEFAVAINPKTGVQDVVLIMMVALLAFGLGYGVLKYKNKPLEI